mmetsp:Transcript_37063/g.57951  ORF Transcript_37063/g.57951 Transcript_37063/m.57951 type:complete len:96 (-) Transcript_37063:43-330(-)
MTGMKCGWKHVKIERIMEPCHPGVPLDTDFEIYLVRLSTTAAGIETLSGLAGHCGSSSHKKTSAFVANNVLVEPGVPGFVVILIVNRNSCLLGKQ